MGGLKCLRTPEYGPSGVAGQSQVVRRRRTLTDLWGQVRHTSTLDVRGDKGPRRTWCPVTPSAPSAHRSRDGRHTWWVCRRDPRTVEDPNVPVYRRIKQTRERCQDSVTKREHVVEGQRERGATPVDIVDKGTREEGDCFQDLRF